MPEAYAVQESSGSRQEPRRRRPSVRPPHHRLLPRGPPLLSQVRVQRREAGEGHLRLRARGRLRLRHHPAEGDGQVAGYDELLAHVPDHPAAGVGRHRYARIAARAQICTQHAYTRPYGIVAMILGIDEEKGIPQLFTCDPAGQVFGHKMALSAMRHALNEGGFRSP